jgi:hypothetical protein
MDSRDAEAEDAQNNRAAAAFPTDRLSALYLASDLPGRL